MNVFRWRPTSVNDCVTAFAVGFVLSHAPFVAGGSLASRLEAGAEGGAMIVIVTVALTTLFFLFVWLVAAPLCAGVAAWRASPAPAGLLVLAVASAMLTVNALFGHYGDLTDTAAFTRWAASSHPAARWLSGPTTMVCLAALFNFVLIVLVHPAVGTWTALRPGPGWRALGVGILTLALYMVFAFLVMLPLLAVCLILLGVVVLVRD